MTPLLRNDAYVIQMLDGYTDGKPSWRLVFAGNRGLIGKAAAESAADELRKKYPHRKYRVRKKQRQ